MKKSGYPLIVLFILSLIGVQTTFATENLAQETAVLNDEFFEIPDGGVGAMDGPITSLPAPPTATVPTVPTPPGDPLDLSNLISLGKTIWQIILDNAPVVNVALDNVSVVPAYATNWQDLEGWAQPVTRLYSIGYKNLYGVQVSKFDFRVFFYPMGNVRGKGKFLANVSIVPVKLDVAWGYTFNAAAKVPIVLNIGTHDDPVAAVNLDMSWNIRSHLLYKQRTVRFVIHGDGQMTVLDSPEANSMRQ